MEAEPVTEPDSPVRQLPANQTHGEGAEGQHGLLEGEEEKEAQSGVAAYPALFPPLSLRGSGRRP